MPDIEEIEFRNFGPIKIPKVPWWNFKRRVYEHWRKSNKLYLIDQDPDILIFEDKEKIDRLGLVFLISFSIGISIFIIINIYLLFLLSEIETKILGGMLLVISFGIGYFMWFSTILQLIDFRSHKQLTINRQTKVITWKIYPWLKKPSTQEVSMDQLVLSKAKRPILNRTTHYPMLYYVRAEIEEVVFDLDGSTSKEKVEKFYQKIILFLNFTS